MLKSPRQKAMSVMSAKIMKENVKITPSKSHECNECNENMCNHENNERKC